MSAQSQATCFGCTLNPNFINPLLYPQSQPFSVNLSGLTVEEKEILRNLGLAWEGYTNLNDIREDFTREFNDAIHRCQSLIALRVAKRVNPEVWK